MIALIEYIFAKFLIKDLGLTKEVFGLCMTFVWLKTARKNQKTQVAIRQPEL